jgi:hypothetical protein
VADELAVAVACVRLGERDAAPDFERLAVYVDLAGVCLEGL